MQNKNNWFSDAIYLDHVTDLTKSNQRGEGLNKDWDPGPLVQGAIDGAGAVKDAVTSGAGQHLLPAAAALAATGAYQAGKKVFQGAKNVAGKVRDAMQTKELSPEEDGPVPAGYAPINRDLAVRRKKVVGGASPKEIVSAKPKPTPMAASFAGMGGVRKSFFTSAVYPEEVGRQDNYSLRKSGPSREPEYVEAPKRPVLAKPSFFETAVWPHEAGHADHYLRKGIVPLDRFGFRKAKEAWEDGPPVDPEADALDAQRMAAGESGQMSGKAPFVPKPLHVRESDAARDSAIEAGTYGPDGDTSRSKPAFVPPGRSAHADGGGDRHAAAAQHFDALLDHAKVQNNPESSPRERNAAAAKIGDAVFKMKRLLPHMTKQHIASLITALKAGDMGALEDIKMNLGMTDHRDDPDQGAYYPDTASQPDDDGSTWTSSNGTKYVYSNKKPVKPDGDRWT